ncbi:MAG: hypothetical protein CL764_01490 [Chloroflexi bacterium]|nr:hypothetical protein [Chloroflexota bacterium]|tara:strand:- start:4460 stop:6889 length:2430 start_codon:yes stop_codon:yes gene_type:complete
MGKQKIYKIFNFLNLTIETVYLFAIFSIPLVFASDNFLAFYQQPKESILHFTGFLSIFLLTIKITLQLSFNIKLDYLESITKNKKVLFLFLAIFLFLFSNFLSSWLSIVPYVSFWGRESGMAGNTLISLISYLGIFLAIFFQGKENNQIKRILITIITSSTIVCIYGLLQHFFSDSIDWYTWMNKGRVYSTLGNPIYLGAYLIMTIPLSIVILNQLSDKLNYKIFLIISSLIIGIQLSVLGLTLSRGPWSGIFIGFISVVFYWILFSRKTNTSIFRFITILLSSFLIAILINYIPVKKEDLKPEDKLTERIGSISENLDLSINQKTGINVSGSGFSGRIEIWAGGIDLIKNWPSPNGLELKLQTIRPLIGYGPDTYIYLYPQTIRPQRDIIVSSDPHNILLRITVELGFLGLITFSSIILISLLIIFDLLKEKTLSSSFESMLIIAIFSGFISHMVEQMTGLAVTSDSLIFWVLISLLCVISINKNPKELNKEKSKSLIKINKSSYSYLLFNIPVLAILIFVYINEINSIKASRYLAKGSELISQGKASEGLQFIEDARILKPFSETYTVESFKLIRKSAISTSLGFNEEEKTKLLIHSYSRLMDFEKINPYSYNVEMFLARTSLDLFLRNPDFKIEVLNRYIYLTQLMPNYTDIFKVSANIFLSIGAFDKALEVTNKAIDLNNNTENPKPIPQAYWVKGEILKIKEKYDEALINLEKSNIYVEEYIKEFSNPGEHGNETVFDEITLNKKRAYQILANQTIGEILSFYDPSPDIKKFLNFEDNKKESNKRILDAKNKAIAFNLNELIKD